MEVATIKKSKLDSSLDQIHDQLGFSEKESTREAIKLMFHGINRFLTEEQAHQLANQLPDNLLMIYLSAWPLNKLKKEPKHLDELVSFMKGDQQKNNYTLFTTEIEVLRAALIMLKILEVEVEVLKLLPAAIRREIQMALIHPIN